MKHTGKCAGLFRETKRRRKSCFVSVVSLPTCFNSGPNFRGGGRGREHDKDRYWSFVVHHLLFTGRCYREALITCICRTSPVEKSIALVVWSAPNADLSALCTRRTARAHPQGAATNRFSADSSSGSPEGLRCSPLLCGQKLFELHSQSMEERVILDRYHHFHGHSGMCA